VRVTALFYKPVKNGLSICNDTQCRYRIWFFSRLSVWFRRCLNLCDHQKWFRGRESISVRKLFGWETGAIRPDRLPGRCGKPNEPVPWFRADSVVEAFPLSESDEITGIWWIVRVTAVSEVRVSPRASEWLRDMPEGVALLDSDLACEFGPKPANCWQWPKREEGTPLG